MCAFCMLLHMYITTHGSKNANNPKYMHLTPICLAYPRNMRASESFSWLQDVEVCSELPYSGYLPSASAFCRLEEHMVPFLYTIPTFF